MTNFEVRGNQNYAAEVIRVERLVELPGLDNLRGVPFAGYMALVGKDTAIGSLMVAFVAETQVTDEFAAEHNLYRKSDKNADTAAVGYLEDNRRIRAIKLRGHVSSALLLPAWLPTMVEGTVFDTIDGVEICHKYLPPSKGSPTQPKQPKADRVFGAAAEALPEHPDTAQWLRNADSVPDETHLVLSQKLHGTSVRAVKAEVPVVLNWLARLAKRLGVPVKDTRVAWIVGSRRVIKSVEGSDKESSNHWYGEGGDIWSKVMQPFADLIPVGVAIYGEIIGWVPGTSTPIQKGYTYRIPQGYAMFYAYRVVSNGFDLSDAGMREFCRNRGINVVPKLWEGPKEAFDYETWVDKDFHSIWGAGQPEFVYHNEPIRLAQESPVDEGVCIRIEGINPTTYKVKGSAFYLHESALLDANVTDMEVEA